MPDTPPTDPAPPERAGSNTPGDNAFLLVFGIAAGLCVALWALASSLWMLAVPIGLGFLLLRVSPQGRSLGGGLLLGAGIIAVPVLLLFGGCLLLFGGL